MTASTELKQKLADGTYKDRLLDIYVDEELIGYQIDRYISAISKYEEIYGEEEVELFSSPGRSEICGNHTDHQQGEILAASINLDAIAVTRKLDERIVRVVSDGYDEIVINLDDLEINDLEKGTTKAIIKGVLAGARKHGFNIGGFRSYITSDVLIGAGLSSSAAFETLIGTIISHLFNEGKLDAITNAIIGQYAENVYFGKPCGLMDQMACAVGSLVHVDFANKQNPVVEKVELELSSKGYSLCITDTKGSHANLTDEYAAIPQEMRNIASFFDKDVLLGISMKDILDNISKLREKFGDRAVLRAMHFISENKRVQAAVGAIKDDNIHEFFDNIRESGNSSFKYLQNVYTNLDVSVQNVSVALAVSENCLQGGKGVSRVHGGGFAGTIQAFVHNDIVKQYQQTMNSVFGEGSCKILQIRKYGAIKVID